MQLSGEYEMICLLNDEKSQRIQEESNEKKKIVQVN